MNDYIPDMTERFPEGLDGIDLTDSYYPPSKMTDDYSMWDDLENENKREEERQKEEHCCLNCRKWLYGTCEKIKGMTRKQKSNHCCSDWY